MLSHVSTSLIFIARKYPLYRYIYPFISWKTFAQVPPFDLWTILPTFVYELLHGHVCSSLRNMPSSGIGLVMFSEVGCTILYPHQQYEDSSTPTSSPNTCNIICNNTNDFHVDPVSAILLNMFAAVLCWVVTDSLWPRGLYPARLLCLCSFPGKNTGVGCHFLLQGIWLTQDQTRIS